MRQKTVESWLHKGTRLEVVRLSSGSNTEKWMVDGYDIWFDGECLNEGDLFHHKPSKKECVDYVELEATGGKLR
jgi:hypothetical protein